MSVIFPLEPLKYAKYFMITCRRFTCVCGKRVWCKNAKLKRVSFTNTHIDISEYREEDFFFWKRLSSQDRWNLPKNNIMNLPFNRTYLGFVFLICSDNCHVFNSEIELLKIPYEEIVRKNHR